ncbi:hypothetical protein [uncultured Fusobacterium sp.]|uniref:hypothetical protein n=1 Tax=uncultured Fusobacterium sp. TaxID=159267 RepID=UPI00261D1DFD|nr:hypothetical protein [uncultured Fusobacterium sp.]
MAIVSIEDILTKSKELEKNQEKALEIEIKRLGGSIKLKKISRVEYLDILSSNSSDKDAETLYGACIEPKLSSDSIINSLECKDNLELVVNKLFTHAEKTSIVKLLLEESGITGDNLITKVAEDIKK